MPRLRALRGHDGRRRGAVAFGAGGNPRRHAAGARFPALAVRSPPAANAASAKLTRTPSEPRASLQDQAVVESAYALPRRAQRKPRFGWPAEPNHDRPDRSRLPRVVARRAVRGPSTCESSTQAQTACPRSSATRQDALGAHGDARVRKRLHHAGSSQEAVAARGGRGVERRLSRRAGMCRRSPCAFSNHRAEFHDAQPLARLTAFASSSYRA